MRKPGSGSSCKGVPDLNPLLIVLVVFILVFCSALLGLFISAMLPDHHLSVDSKDVVKLSMGLIATMAALVLGLLISSAKNCFDTATSEIQQSAANIVQLDNTLMRYGPESKQARSLLQQIIEFRLHRLWPEDAVAPAKLKAPRINLIAEDLEECISKLPAQTEAQRERRARALQISRDLMAMRYLLVAQASSPLPMPFLCVLVFWLCILFASFGLFAPRNATVIASIMLCALAVSGSTFLILEMYYPFDGLIKVSSAPLQYALSQLGQ